jgi:hypothetical protein
VRVSLQSVAATGTTAGLSANDAALRAMLSLNSPATVIGSTTTSGTIDWAFNSGSESFDHLAAGQSLDWAFNLPPGSLRLNDGSSFANATPFALSDADSGDTLTASLAGPPVVRLNGTPIASGYPAGLVMPGVLSLSLAQPGAVGWVYDPAAVDLDFLSAGDCRRSQRDRSR